MLIAFPQQQSFCEPGSKLAFLVECSAWWYVKLPRTLTCQMREDAAPVIWTTYHMRITAACHDTSLPGLIQMTPLEK